MENQAQRAERENAEMLRRSKGGPIFKSQDQLVEYGDAYAKQEYESGYLVGAKACDAVVKAFSDKGSHPDWHDQRVREVMDYLKVQWPTLYNALSVIEKEVQEGKNESN